MKEDLNDVAKSLGFSVIVLERCSVRMIALTAIVVPAMRKYLHFEIYQLYFGLIQNVLIFGGTVAQVSLSIPSTDKVIIFEIFCIRYDINI